LQIPCENHTAELRLKEPVSLYHTFFCGQCFRWRPDGDGFFGVAWGRAARVWSVDGVLHVTGSGADSGDLWRRYFDLDRAYADIYTPWLNDPFMSRAVAHGEGLRILAQQPWESLCSFLLSQCCNIPRIRAMVDCLCRRFGEPISFQGLMEYAFPTPERLAGIKEEELVCIRAGYRAKYILAAARAVASGSLDLDRLQSEETEKAREELMRVEGVGRKVADCALLYGLGKLDAFPVDTWMKKARAYHPAYEGEYAGIAQQYIFYYARETGLR